MPRLGVGLITFNRRDSVMESLARVRRLTTEESALIVVADDGSSDGTREAIGATGVPLVGGVNRGIAWNKNRALFLLGELLGCEAVILLEDDVLVNESGWERDWIEATRRWGHVNWAAPWIGEYFDFGDGTPESPIMSTVTSAQCAAFSADALRYAGYMDPRFQGFGHEHIEHSRRLVRCGHGGIDRMVDGREYLRFALINANFIMAPSISHFDEPQSERNRAIAHVAMADRRYRAPWANEEDMARFREEMRCAMAGGFEAFRLGRA